MGGALDYLCPSNAGGDWPWNCLAVFWGKFESLWLGNLVDPRKKLLVADDDEAIQICMEDISQQEGWDLVFARDGEECLNLVDSVGPALIVLDQRMPKMTGEEVLGKLQDQGKDIPVILISAEKDLSRMRRFPSIVTVLTKPFDLDDFVFLVNDHLAKSDS
jgi:two-component system, response regulator, stage 0 sporulation protein F